MTLVVVAAAAIIPQIEIVLRREEEGVAGVVDRFRVSVGDARPAQRVKRRLSETVIPL